MLGEQLANLRSELVSHIFSGGESIHHPDQSGGRGLVAPSDKIKELQLYQHPRDHGNAAISRSHDPGFASPTIGPADH
jgi:hypothetical protein